VLQTTGTRSTVEVLKNILSIHKGYPVHSDAIPTVLKAHKELGLEYMVNRLFGAAWECEVFIPSNNPEAFIACRRTDD